MGSLSPVHWIIVLVVIMLLFGPKALAGMGKGLGEGLRSFKKGLAEDPPEEALAEPKPPAVDTKQKPPETTQS